MISVWNVRGMNVSTKQRDVDQFVNSNKVGLMGFLETKLTNDSLLKYYRKLFNYWRSLDNCDLHPRGRVWVVWQESEFEVLHVRKDNCFIHLVVECKRNQR